jgi:hypothetical protein
MDEHGAALARIAKQWLTLPDAIRTAILMLVDAGKGGPA